MKKENYTTTQKDFVSEVRSKLKTLDTEISDRNDKIQKRDNFIYGDGLREAINVPIGHDFTRVNWLRRTVEIHKNMFMSRGFHVLSTYDTNDISEVAEENEKRRLEIENDKEKEFAEARMQTIKAIKEDNGGDAFWANLAENASAIGDVAIKMYYDEDSEKIELCHIESIENLYALWSKDDFRDVEAYGFVYQVSKSEAISEYGASEDVATSPLGRPLDAISTNNVAIATNFGQEMVSILEVTGKIEGWTAENGQLKRCKVGQETEINVLIIGDEVTRLITDKKKLPKYYILPNKRQRRRPWGVSDISDAAIEINLTYIETLSDWRTVSSKVNFPKFKAFGFSPAQKLHNNTKRLRKRSKKQTKNIRH